MAALSMGSFGAYKQAYQKYVSDQDKRDKELHSDDPVSRPETVWITKRYIPTDLRSTAPVPRHKLVAPKSLPPAERHWIPGMEPPLRSFERAQSAQMYTSHPATRSEEFSTLRQMLPSDESIHRLNPPAWGTSYSLPPIGIAVAPKRFPLVNSPMTRYVDDMHLTNRLFRLH